MCDAGDEILPLVSGAFRPRPFPDRDAIVPRTWYKVC
jgi:hypothetical protein